MSSTLEDIRQKLILVCDSCGRDPKTITLVAVTKKQPIEKIREAYAQKQFDFGENYVQEALEKQEVLPMKDIRWHMIGPIQKNKINKIIGNFFLIHSVDSFKNALEINQRAEKNNLKVSVLLQVNLANEETKSGQSKDELQKNWESYKSLKFLQIEGLMTMPPLQDDSEKSRPYFKELKLLANQLQLKHLSMGTSSDWKVAVEEGSTLIRIGTAVFGERNS